MNTNVAKKSGWQALFTDFMTTCHFEENGFMRFDRIQGGTKHRVQHLNGELYYCTAEYHSNIMDYGPWKKILMVDTYVSVPTAIIILSAVRAIDLAHVPKTDAHAFA